MVVGHSALIALGVVAYATEVSALGTEHLNRRLPLPGDSLFTGCEFVASHEWRTVRTASRKEQESLWTKTEPTIVRGWLDFGAGKTTDAAKWEKEAMQRYYGKTLATVYTRGYSLGDLAGGIAGRYNDTRLIDNPAVMRFSDFVAEELPLGKGGQGFVHEQGGGVPLVAAARAAAGHPPFASDVLDTSSVTVAHEGSYVHWHRVEKATVTHAIQGSTMWFIVDPAVDTSALPRHWFFANPCQWSLFKKQKVQRCMQRRGDSVLIPAGSVVASCAVAPWNVNAETTGEVPRTAVLARSAINGDANQTARLLVKNKKARQGADFADACRLAAHNGEVEVLEALGVDACAQVALPTKPTGLSDAEKRQLSKWPLLAAAEGGHDMATELLARATPAELRPLAFSGTVQLRGSPTTVRYLFEGAYNTPLPVEVNPMMGGEAVLHVAAGMGHTKLVHFLVGNGASLSMKNKDGELALHHAARAGAVDVLSVLAGGEPVRNAEGVVSVPPLINAKSSSNAIPLHFSCWAGRAAATERLMELGSDVNAQASAGFYPLHMAVMGNHLEVVKVLSDRALRHPGARENLIALAKREGKQAIVDWLTGKDKERERQDKKAKKVAAAARQKRQRGEL